MSELPNGWETTTLGDIISLNYGKALGKKARTDGLYNVYGSSGAVGTHKEPLTEKGGLIIGRKGSVGRAYLEPNPFWPIDTTYFFCGTESHNLKYLKFLLDSLDLKKLDKSTAVPGLNRDDAYRVNISLPPLNEQHRIVNKIEELFTKLDAGVASLKKAQQLLKQYRQSVLKAAFEGKLTEEWRKDQLADPESPLNKEPASVLLEKIKVERRKKLEEAELAKMKSKGKEPKNDKWKEKYKEPKTGQVDDLYSIPTDWEVTSTETIFDFVTSGSRGWAKYYSDDGPIFLRMTNLDHDTIDLDLSDIQNVQPPDGAEGSRTRVQVGDILISITADLGMIGLIKHDIGEAYINQHVALSSVVHPN